MLVDLHLRGCTSDAGVFELPPTSGKVHASQLTSIIAHELRGLITYPNFHSNVLVMDFGLMLSNMEV